jgi:hypothetical protein
MKQPARLCGVLLLAGALSGCATYSDSAIRIERAVVQGNPQQAIALLDKDKGFFSDEALRQLNLAIVLRMNGGYAASNAALETAKTLIDQRSAVSVSEQTGTLLINEAMASFVGEPFEQALVHFYAALNYLQLGKRDEARVEALQVDLLLKELAEKTPKSAQLYREDPLCRYLAGMIFEDLGEWSDALIAYRKAYESYDKFAGAFGVPVPSTLKEDLLRLTDRQGLIEERRRYEERFNQHTWTPFEDWRKQGEVVFVLHAGLAPVKRSRETRVVEPKHGQLVSIALPAYEPRPNPLSNFELRVDGQTIRGEPAENVSGIAERSLEARLPGLTAKAVARAALKYNAAQSAHREKGDVAGLLVNVVGALTEVADTRSWTLLPDEVLIARMRLPPGTYSVHIKLLGGGGQPLREFTFDGVAVEASRKTFLEHHWISPDTLIRRAYL